MSTADPSSASSLRGPLPLLTIVLAACLVGILAGCGPVYMAERTSVQGTTGADGQKRLRAEYLVLDPLELSMHWHEGMPADSVELGARPDAHLFQDDDTGPLRERFDSLAARPIDSLTIRVGAKTVRLPSVRTDRVPIETTPGSSPQDAIEPKTTVPRGRFRIAQSTLLGLADSTDVRLTLYLGPRVGASTGTTGGAGGAPVVGVDEAMGRPEAVVAVQGGWTPSTIDRDAERLRQRLRGFLGRRETLTLGE